MEEMHRTSYGEGGKEFPCPLGASLSPNLHAFTNLETLWPPSLWVSLEPSWRRHGWLHHWLLAISSTSSPALLSQGQGWDWKFQPSNHRVGSPGDQPHPSLWPQSHFINITSGVIERGLWWITRHLYHAHHLRNSKGFRSSVPGTGMKTKYRFLYIHHTITTLFHPPPKSPFNDDTVPHLIDASLSLASVISNTIKWHDWIVHHTWGSVGVDGEGWGGRRGLWQPRRLEMVMGWQEGLSGRYLAYDKSLCILSWQQKQGFWIRGWSIIYFKNIFTLCFILPLGGCDEGRYHITYIKGGLYHITYIKGGLCYRRGTPELWILELLFYFWLRWVFVAARRLSLVAASGGYSSLRCAGFSLRWLLLLRSTGPRHLGFSSCGMWAQ